MKNQFSNEENSCVYVSVRACVRACLCGRAHKQSCDVFLLHRNTYKHKHISRRNRQIKQDMEWNGEKNERWGEGEKQRQRERDQYITININIRDCNVSVNGMVRALRALFAPTVIKCVRASVYVGKRTINLPQNSD